MDEKTIYNHRLATFAWAALFIWWGTVIIINPLTIGIGAVGTGLILLSVNAVRTLKGIPIKNDNAVIGASLILWGVLDHARHMLALSPWLSFALLFLVIGLVLLYSALFVRPKPPTESHAGDV